MPPFRRLARRADWPAVLLSIGQSQVSILKRYVARQKPHHQRVSFQDEYRKFLKTYGVEYDERYVWD